MEYTFTVANFEEEVLNSPLPVLVDFYADWCGPCKMMAPAVEALANEQDEVTVGKLNVDFAPELASNLLDTPNNLLGLEYLKALKRLHSTILPHTIQREGNAYHDITITDERSASASGIRASSM